MADEYRRFWITSSTAVEREWLLAEAFEAGAEGAEEVGDLRACIYAPSNKIEPIRIVLAEIASDISEIGPAEAMPNIDWSEAWKEGLEALHISHRLVIRPPFIDVELLPGQKEIVIDPGQAFGTGDHASTRLCLEWLDVFASEVAPMEGTEPGGADLLNRVLDVGTGSGVLALAAIALGGQGAIGFDLDPVAVEAARMAAQENGLTKGAHFFTGQIEAVIVGDGGYSLVLANLLKNEMLPIASEIAACMQPSGRLVLAGLLEEDVAEVLGRFSKEGLVEVGRRSREDSVGCWIGLCLAFA